VGSVLINVESAFGESDSVIENGLQMGGDVMRAGGGSFAGRSRYHESKECSG